MASVDLDVNAAVSFVNQRGYTKVCVIIDLRRDVIDLHTMLSQVALQFPDDLLMKAPSICRK